MNKLDVVKFFVSKMTNENKIHILEQISFWTSDNFSDDYSFKAEVIASIPLNPIKQYK